MTHPPEFKALCEELERRAMKLVMRDGHCVSLSIGQVDPYQSDDFYSLDLDDFHISFSEKAGLQIRSNAATGSPLSFTAYSSDGLIEPDYKHIRDKLLPFLRNAMVLDDLADV